MAPLGYDLIYQNASLYNIAFSYRSIPSEIDFLLLAARMFGRRGEKFKPARALDYACGPAYHLRELAARDISAIGVDLSKSMVLYAIEEAQREAVQIEILCGDMRTTSVSPGVDLAFSMLGSVHHLLSDKDLASHLSAAFRSLNTDGIYIIEAIHPDDFEALQKSDTSWEIKNNTRTIKSRWRVTERLSDDLYETELSFSAFEGSIIDSQTESVCDRCILRRYGPATFQKIVDQEGSFELVKTLGGFSTDFSFSQGDAWRQILILRPRS